MNTIDRLKALEKEAIQPYRTMSVLAETSSDGKVGDCRVWHGQEAGRCIAVFKHEPTARLYLESRRSMAALLKVAEAAKAMIDEAKGTPGGLASMEGICIAIAELEAQ